jgi:hypothetical protein
VAKQASKDNLDSLFRSFLLRINHHSPIIMGAVFGKEKPLKEIMRENKRTINRAIRELDREKNGLEREEKRLTMEIKKAAKDQQMASVRIMAKVGKRYIYTYIYL